MATALWIDLGASLFELGLESFSALSLFIYFTLPRSDFSVAKYKLSVSNILNRIQAYRDCLFTSSYSYLRPFARLEQPSFPQSSYF